jgi:hypothetical protein
MIPTTNMMAPAMRVDPTNPRQSVRPPGTATTTLALGPQAPDGRESRDAMVTKKIAKVGAWQVLPLLLPTTSN